MKNDVLTLLQNWYESKCDGKWELENNITINSIENPGWKVIISGETKRSPMNIQLELNDFDWIDVIASSTEFHGYGGTQNLYAILDKACDWLNLK